MNLTLCSSQSLKSLDLGELFKKLHFVMLFALLSCDVGRNLAEPTLASIVLMSYCSL